MKSIEALRARLITSVMTAGFVATAGASVSAQQPARLTQFLRQSIGLDASQLAAVERGEAVARVLETQTTRDVAIFGIVTTTAARDDIVQQLRDFKTWLRSPSRLRFGIFADPAVPTDVQSFTAEESDVDDLRECRPSDCKFKLPATEMRRIGERIDWSAPDARSRVTAYVRQRLVDYVTDYRARGDSAMVVYDGPGSVRASDAFAALLAQSPYVYEYVPSLQRYLSSYPRGRLDGADEVLFWSEDRAPRLRNILSVTHLMLYSPPELPGATLVAAKQIYADHYFEAAFDLMTLVDREANPGPKGSYVLGLRRFRFDNLPTGGLLNIRGRAINGLRAQLLADLKRTKMSVERDGSGR